MQSAGKKRAGELLMAEIKKYAGTYSTFTAHTVSEYTGTRPRAISATLRKMARAGVLVVDGTAPHHRFPSRPSLNVVSYRLAREGDVVPTTCAAGSCLLAVALGYGRSDEWDRLKSMAEGVE